jgi:hypothetical protein
MRRADLVGAWLCLAVGCALVVADENDEPAAEPAAKPASTGGHYHKESAYTSGASYGAPHFLILCILLVFVAAGCKEAYDRYGSPEAKKKEKKKHDTIGGYGSVGQEEEADQEAPSLFNDLKGLAGGGAGAVGGGVGKVSGEANKVVGIFTAAAKNITADLQKVGVVAVDKAKSGVSDAVNVSAHLDKVKQGVSVVGNVASAAAADAKKGAEAAAAKGLDTARSAADVNAHLEKAKAAASVAANVATSATGDLAKASKDAASAGLNSATAAASAGLDSARSAGSSLLTTKSENESGAKMEFDKSTVRLFLPASAPHTRPQ